MDIELGATIIATVIAAFLGFYWAKRRDDRLRVIDRALELFSGELSERRTATLKKVRSLSTDELIKTARQDDPLNEETRQAALDLMNRHELLCELYNSNLIDRRIFNHYLRDAIISDFAELEAFRDRVHDDFVARGFLDKRPFYPEVKKMAQSLRYSFWYGF